MTTHAHNHHRRFHASVSIRETVLVALVATLAGVAIYISTDTNTAFGLLNQPVYADFVPVEITFRTQALVSQPFLELQFVDRNKSTTQVSADLFDPTNPPPVENLTALNTRIGSEVIVYWTFPNAVTTANVYRTDTTAAEKEILVANNVADAQYQDVTVTDSHSYTYRVVSTVVDGDATVESTTKAPTATVTPSDTVPPQAPTDVRVTQVDGDSGKVLQVDWVNPTETDVTTIHVYRSTHFGTRGDKVATVQASDPATFIDVDAPKNTTVYYTVVAYDQAGNGSSDDFQMPVPGNSSPFTPIGVAP